MINAPFLPRVWQLLPGFVQSSHGLFNPSSPSPSTSCYQRGELIITMKKALSRLRGADPY